MPSEIIDSLAKKILDKVNNKVVEENRYGIDPITIIIIIGVILNLIRVIQECRKDKMKLFTQRDKSEFITAEVRFQSLNHSWLTRRRLKKIIRNHLTSEQNKVYGDALLSALLEEGKNTTEEQVCALMEYRNV